jgi:hypothetical protein
MGPAGAGPGLANPSQPATVLVGPVFPAYGPLQVGPSGLVQIHNGVPVPYPDKRDEPRPVMPPTEPERPPQPELAPPPPLDLPPKWKWARDKRGRIYYYHAKERVSQWLPPPPDHIAVQPDSSTTSESSGESSESEEEEEEAPEEQTAEPQPTEGMDLDLAVPEAQPKSDVAAPTSVVPETKKRREGLVQERIISVSISLLTLPPPSLYWLFFLFKYLSIIK